MKQIAVVSEVPPLYNPCEPSILVVDNKLGK